MGILSTGLLMGSEAEQAALRAQRVLGRAAAPAAPGGARCGVWGLPQLPWGGAAHCAAADLGCMAAWPAASCGPLSAPATAPL